MQNLTKILFLTILICSYAFNQSFSQVLDVVTYDVTTNTFDKPLPFDKPSKVVFEGEQFKSVKKIWIYETFHRKGQMQLYKAKGKIKKDSSDLLKFKLVGEATIIKTSKGIIAIMPPLMANKSFTLAFIHSYVGEKLKPFYNLNKSIRQNKKADKQFNHILNSSIVDLSGTYYFNSNIENKDQIFTSFLYINYSQYLKFYHLQLDSLFNNITDKIQTKHFDYLKNDSIMKLGILCNQLKIKNDSLIKLNAITPNLLAFQKGLVNIDLYPQISPIDTFDFKERIRNLDKATKYISDVQNTVEKIILTTSDSTNFLREVKQDISELNVVLDKNKGILKKNYEAINSTIEKNDSLSYIQFGVGNSDFTDIKTKGSYYIIPNLGLSYVPAVGNYDIYKMVIPYIGASIYLKPVDKNTPFRYYKNSFLYRTSLNVGMSAVETNNDEFKDLYNKMSLMLGANFKITQEISISAGAIFLRRKNVNIAIDNYIVTPMFYTGFAFDLDFMNAISKLTSKIY